jgi:prefoldin subunit 5
MLKKEAISKIATNLKIKEADLIAALTATEETDITIPEINSFTTDELATRDTNLKATGYTEGKIAGTEMLIKDLKTKHAIEIDSKDADKFIDAFKDKVLKEAKVEPNQKISELNATIAQLQGNITAFDTEKAGYLNQINAIKIDSKLSGLLPKNINPVLTSDIIMNDLKSNYEFTSEDGKSVVKKDGQILKDAKLVEPLSWDTVINQHLAERKWLVEEPASKQGRGVGSDSSGGIKLRLSDFVAEWKAAGKSENSAEFTSAVMAAKEANPSFDMNA